MKRLVSVMILLAQIVFTLSMCACSKNGDIPVVSVDPGSQEMPLPPDNPALIASDSVSSECFYGAYLTMYSSPEPVEFPYLRLFHSYSEVESYFYSNERYFFFGKRFTMACASFTDEFLAKNDLMMLVISEPSTYTSYTAEKVSISDGAVSFGITRHIPENAPKNEESAVYHLIFTAPKGTFESVGYDKFTLSVTEQITPDNTQVYDAERFRYIYPEFWPFAHKADAIRSRPTPVISTVTSYDDLIGFYESYKDTFDLDTDFVRYIGTVYFEEMFDDYILLLAALPFDSRKPKPAVKDVFLYNLNLWITIDGYSEEIPEDYTRWYVMAVAIVKNSLEGVDMGQVYIG